MSHELLVCLTAVAVTLIAMTVIYSLLSHALARWGPLAVMTVIVVSQLAWIAPAVWIVEGLGGNRAGSYALWLGNWLVAGFSIVLLGKAVALIPIGLTGTARMDGLNGFAAWRRVVFPFVRKDLLILAIFTVMATLLPFWGVINQPQASNSVIIYERSWTTPAHLGWMAAGSLIGAVPLIAIFFLATRRR